MAVNPDLNREGIIQYLTLMELGYEELPLEGALKCAQRVLVESDYQFIRENDEYLSFEVGTPLQVRLKAILAIFDHDGPLDHESSGWILASKHKLPPDAGNASVDTDLVRELFKPHPKDDVQVDPFSHPDDEV